MTIRTILVPIRGDGKGEAVLDHALALAQRFDAHLDVIHCRPRPEDLLPFGVFVPAALKREITASAGSVANEEENRLKDLFEDYCQRHGLTVVAAPPWPRDKVSVSWREETGKQAKIVGLRGRLADVIVVARPDRAQNLGLNTLEAALLETGRLVMMCPPQGAASVGNHVALAWNGSAESARAVSVGLPVLGAASAVTVLSVDTGAKTELGPDDLKAHLAAHGIDADSRLLNAKSAGVGDALMAAAKQAGADVLLMGAYGQSRRRELVMGGVTQHVIEHADIPVLLIH